MKFTKTMKALFTMLAVMLAVFSINAQPMNRVSPHETAKGIINGANITITYGSPGVKGRQIFGGLVPYDKAWRAGADEATTFETDKDLMVQGKKLPAGTYTVFYTPGKEDWTVVFNTQTKQWGITRGGAANFDPAKNVLEVKVKAKKIAMKENLTYMVTNNGFDLQWDTVSVPVMLK